jgi:Zn-dependent protease with chaperone function
MGKRTLCLLVALVAACEQAGRDPARPVRPADEVKTDELMRANATLPSDPALAQAYREVNARFFDSRLPDVRIRWEPRLEEIGPLIAPAFRLEGVTDGNVILLHPVLEQSERQLKAVLVHEMVHVALRDRAETHGAAFQSRLRALADSGAFEGVPATDEEKQQLKASLDQRSAALSTELTELNQLRARLESEAATMPREALQDRTWEFNTRVRRHNQDADEFNRLVEQYNLMIAYPDGLDRARVAPRPTVAVAGAK